MSSPNTPVGSQDTWESRINSASAMLGKSFQETEQILKSLGVEKETNGLAMLSDEEVTPFGDLRRAFCEESNVPIAKLRMAIKHLRGSKEAEKASEIDPEVVMLQQKFGYTRKLKDVDPTELIEYYNPLKISSPIAKVLKDHFGDKNVIAFKPGTKEVAVEQTIDYISDLEQGLEVMDSVDVDGSLVKLYPIGVIPDQAVEEDPLFEGHSLRRGRSQVNHVNWTNVKLEARQFCRLVVKEQEIDPNDKLDVRTLVKLAEEGLASLKKVYPEVDLLFRQLTEDDELPKLRLKISEIQNGSSYGGKKGNPFAINRNY